MTIVEEIGRSQGEPGWAIEARRNAFEIFAQTPLPNPRVGEHWRRTDLAALGFEESLLQPEKFRPVSRAGGGRLPAEIRSLEAVKAPDLLVSVDGDPRLIRLRDDLTRAGVIFTDLACAFREHGERIRKYLDGVPCDPDDQKFTSLARAFGRGGVFLYVPKGLEVALPFRAYTLLSEGSTIFPRTLVIAEPGSRVTLLDTLLSPDTPEQVLSSGVVDLYLGAGAEVRYAQAVRWGHSVYHFCRERAVLEQDAHLLTLTMGLGGRLSKTTIESLLLAPGGTSDMLGLVFGQGHQHFDHHTIQDHRAVRTTSDLLFKVALDDEAHSTYSGLIRIAKQAQQSNAYQSNRNMLLSKTAHADSIPNLEIEANDVRCTHGAAVAPVDEEQLFYLMSRGLPLAEARQLIVEGFFEPVLDRFGSEALHPELSAWIGAKISGQEG